MAAKNFDVLSTLYIGNQRISIRFYAENIIRILINNNVQESLNDYILSESLDEMPHEFSEYANRYSFEYGVHRVEIDKEGLQLNIWREDELVFSTQHGKTFSQRKHDSVFRIHLNEEEGIYGLGQDHMANLNQRNHERRMWNEWNGFTRNENAAVPFYLSTAGYGLFLNTTWPSRFYVGNAEGAEATHAYGVDMAPQPEYWEDEPDERNPEGISIINDEKSFDLFIFTGSYDSIYEAFRLVTGEVPLPPKWAFGLIQSKNRYRTADELLNVGKAFRKRGIPCDCLVIDWLWFKEFGDLSWEPKGWGNAPEVFEELQSMGFKVMQAQHPYIDEKSLNYEHFREKGFLNDIPGDVQNSFDFTNPDARAAWWERFKSFYKDGIRGYWTDMGELEKHPRGSLSYLGNREKIHNIYSLLWAKTLYEGQRETFDERVFTLARTTYAGMPRFGAALWSGDVNSSWDILQRQIKVAQGVATSAVPYWTTDIGGFFSDVEFSRELYIRWYQFGTFCSLFRTHGTRPDNEPWALDEGSERIITSFIRLRYRLMPYIYSLAHQVNTRGTPFIRPMFMAFPDDPVAAEAEYQYMFGPSILVAPVYREGKRTRKVYLPEGEWIDYWSDRRLTGGRWLWVLAPLDRIPLFIKAGSIIPMIAAGQNTQSDDPVIYLHLYPGKSCVFELYEDDGQTYRYESGDYALTRLEMDKRGTLVKKSTGNSNWIPTDRQYLEVLHDVPEKKTRETFIDYNQEPDGTTLIQLLISNVEDIELKGEAELFIPFTWCFEESPEIIRFAAKDFRKLSWVIKPDSEARPVVEELTLEIRYDTGETVHKKMTIGSGYVTAWELSDHFDYSQNPLEKILEPETDSDKPYYLEADAASEMVKQINWKRLPAYEFNAFGYVNFPRPSAAVLIALRGIVYAKTRVWSEEEKEVFIDISAEPCIKIILNGEGVYRHDAFLNQQILPEGVTLKKGWNTLLLKLAIDFDKPYSGRELGFKFRFTDENGTPVKELLYKP